MVHEPHRKTVNDGVEEKGLKTAINHLIKSCCVLNSEAEEKSRINVLLALNNSRKPGGEPFMCVCVCVPSNHFVIWTQTLTKTFKRAILVGEYILGRIKCTM